MVYKHIFHTIDLHTAGEPTRVVIAGIPFIKSQSMAEKRSQLMEKYDYIRTMLMHEPRGHANMFGAIITAPIHPEAHLGVVFLDSGGYLAMCVHGSIGVVTAALEMGLVPYHEPETEVIMDTPAGLVRARAQVKDGRSRHVTITNVPAYLGLSGVNLEASGVGNIMVDIAFGGNFFALVDAQQLGIPVDLKYLPELIEKGMAIRRAANEQINIQHPLQPCINTIDLVEFYESFPGAELGQRNVVVFGHGQVDRSPCGTGTCAKMAALHASGRLSLGETYVSQSILGTKFTGRLLSHEQLGAITAVVPEITGSASVIGFQQFVVDVDDPLKVGFLLSGSSYHG